MNDKLIARDRLRYEKNKLSSGIALVAIAFNALFFASIYRGVYVNIGNYYFTLLMGASVVYNLVFMLAAFLSSEGVKNYKLGFSFVLFALAALQIARIFVYPVNAHSTALAGSEGKLIMETPQFIRCIIYLCLSSVCLVISGVFNVFRSLELKAYVAEYGERMPDFTDKADQAPIADAAPEDVSASAAVFGQEPVATDGGDAKEEE